MQKGSFVRIDANLARDHLYENYKGHMAECHDHHLGTRDFKVSDFIEPKNLYGNKEGRIEVEENHELELIFRPYPEI